MRKAIITLFLFFPLVVNATTYYVSTTGSNSNSGTISSPWATWDYGMNHLSAGDILYIRGGTYTSLHGLQGSNYFGVYLSGKNGTSANHITVSNYPGEVPILDGTAANITSGSNVGIGYYSCQYWDFIGLNVTNFVMWADGLNDSRGWFGNNVAFITHTLCTDYHCSSGFALTGTHHDISYVNCDSYENADRYIDPDGSNGGKAGGLADGYYCTPGTGDHISYTGCRAWNNSDDGWDSFNSYGGYITYLNCWSFDNGQCPAVAHIAYTSGDGSGFKFGIINGPVESGVQRTLKNCMSFGNKGPGYDQNSGSSGTIVQIALYNCTSANNQNGTFAFYYDNKAIIKNFVSYNETLGDIGKSTSIDHNSWQNGMSAASSDFLGTNIAEASAPRKADGSLPDMNFLHLAPTSKLIDAGVNVGLPYNGNAPDLGAFESGGTGVVVTAPVYTSAAISSTTPTMLELTYSMALANIVPAASAFKVMVNSTARTVNSVAISGTKVQLTLASQVVSTDIITVAYTQPSTNPLQASAGGQAASIGAQPVTNSVATTDSPVYVSSAVANATPSLLEMTYSTTLANIRPATSSFAVQVNAVARSVSSLAISGTKVQLTLSSAIKYGDIVTVKYTKPSTNPLQASSGGTAATISAQTVANYLVNPTKDGATAITMTISPNHVHKIINVALTYSETPVTSITSESLKISNTSGKLYLQTSLTPGATSVRIPLNLRQGIYIVAIMSNGLQATSQKMVVY